MSLHSTFLEGIRVLDLSRHLPGPLCSLYLTDLGADVLKIEPPQGDEIREIGPKGEGGRPIFFEAINAGKRSCRMDLTNAEQKRQFLSLVEEADIVLESFRPGVLERLGIGYEQLKAENPGIIVCSLNGFGSEGPNKMKAGHDSNFLAQAGVLDRNRTDGKINLFDPAVADCSASFTAAIALLGALRRKERTGEGCHIDAALADAVMPLQTLEIAAMDATGVPPTADTGLFIGSTGYYNIYTTSDKKEIMLGSVEPKFWQSFCQTAGREDWIKRQSDPLPQTALIAEVSAYFETLSLQTAIALFEPIDCCFSTVFNLKEALDSEQVKARKLVRKDDSGNIQALFPVHINNQPPELRNPIEEIPSSTTPCWKKPKG